MLRRAAGSRADPIVAALLKAFATFGRLPTRAYTAAFVALCARKAS